MSALSISLSESESEGTGLLVSTPLSHEELVARQLVDGTLKIQRLLKLKEMMAQSPSFDDDDVRRVQAEVQAVENTTDVVRRGIPRRQWPAVRMFTTLRHRELELEAAVAAQLLYLDEDAELFQGLVKKQVYLTRLASEAAEQASAGE